MSQDSFPRQQARTQRFTLGRPRSFAVSPDGRSILFLRSAGGADPVGRLWRLDTTTGAETELASPSSLLAGHDEDLPAEERARRERMREAAAGIVSYTVDRAFTFCVFALSGRVFAVDLATGTSRELPTEGAVVDPRVDPTGRYVAYCSAGALRVVTTDGRDDRQLVHPDGDGVSWGLADFIGAEELDRSRGYWWSPTGESLLVERVDESPVTTWFVSDPANPERQPTAQRYPRAGSRNADVTLWHVPLDAPPTPVDWDADAWEYLAAVHWSTRGAPLVQLLSRDQRASTILSVDPASGTTTVLRTIRDEHWVDVAPGVPSWTAAGELLTVEAVEGRHALCVDGVAVSAGHLQVRGVLDVDGTDVLFIAQDQPSEQQVWSWDHDGCRPLTTEPGLHARTRGSAAGSGTWVEVSTDLATSLPTARYHSPGSSASITSHAELPTVRPSVALLPGGRDDLRVAVVLPSAWRSGDPPLPVLLDPYGGPHAQRVLASQGAFRESQWWADQGFAVVVVDGRGTPGSPAWERAISADLAAVVLEDQVFGLQAAAHAYPQLDLDRVAIRGWSFGGYLAALAVIDRPDVFHAAIAGAPVTDWRLYDTAYTERYLGHPDAYPDAYRAASLLERASALTRPLMLIHGLADDNVFVAHTLQLSARLTAAGRAHTVLPLSGVTHMASQEDVAENLLLLQVEFLRQTLTTSRTSGK